MAVTIDATVGGASANSYATLAEAETHCEAKPAAWAASVLWAAATDDAKNRALVTAQREMQVMAWKGDRTDSTQALAWPRTYCPNPDAPYDDDADEVGYYDTDAIPDRIKRAQIERAFLLIGADDTDTTAPDGTEGVKRERLDVLETEYFESGRRTTRGLSRYPTVMNELAPLLDASAGGLPVVRV